jgi:hypothetical protein
MFLKRMLIVSAVASLGLLTAACSHDAQDACNHINDICKSQQGFQSADCSKANDQYDKLSDSDKKKEDDLISCVMDANACSDAVKCALDHPVGTTTTTKDGG